jgi:penicillin amidase
MILKHNIVKLQGQDGTITIKRNRYGVPEISATTMRDASFAMGWVQCNDRQMQMMLTRAILEGRASEKIAHDNALIEADKYMRSLNLYPDIEEQRERLEAPVKEMLEAYTFGVNKYLERDGTVFEFKLTGYKPEPWHIFDTMMLAKVFTYFGLTDVQGNMEKLIVEMVQNGIDEKRLKELFPYISEKIDVELLKKIKPAPPIVPDAAAWLSIIPRLTGSNNWAVAGKYTESGEPILCGDPHLEVNRMPAIWHEVVIKLPDNTIKGFALPGTPCIVIGRNNHIAFSPTYSFMDMIDFRIEECKNGKYRRGKEWIPFDVREEVIRTKKGEEIKLFFYENEHGLLEGDPFKEGFYLVRSWSAAKDCGAAEVNVTCNIMTAANVRDAMKLYRDLDAASFNFAIADTTGNIGMQMSGRLFNRPKGVSGLIPLPGWEKKYNSRGFVPKNRLPRQYNPSSGIIVTANQDVNHLGECTPINLPMASYRAERITQLLKGRKRCDVEYMKDIHYDLYSLQGEKFMEILMPLIPDHENGQILKEWDCRYNEESKGAMLFEEVYLSILKVIFGDNGMGRETIDYLLKETSIFNDYYGNFDNIIFRKKSAWYKNTTRDDLLRQAIDEGLNCRAVPYGSTRMIYFKHLFFADKIPPLFGFDYGPVSLPGNRATITQGQIFNAAGRTTTFSPSCRIITDMAYKEMYTNTTGGNCDRRFSRWYSNNMKDWLNGTYKTII